MQQFCNINYPEDTVSFHVATDGDRSMYCFRQGHIDTQVIYRERAVVTLLVPTTSERNWS